MIVKQHCEQLHDRDANPAIIVDKLRPFTQRIWQNFSSEERRVFAAQHAARWNVLRHRIAPDVYAQQSVTADLVINATGPSIRFTSTTSALLQNLLRRGLVAPDDIDMGPRVERDHTIVKAAGERSPWLLGATRADVAEERQLQREYML